ncbi:non-ribosomal peptide synthetase [Rosenbergiella nectarea]|uniref:non-ribosomal peptide synthetase n=1 Tax=Rosenbergiella nectarea TaxID=988801 RepID=UPI001BD9FA69|nr:non-ribosomal peptide synthetase [Rosenbergiella nectarea]MBT0728727.1 amino acid adenylation domain-containing protein [Rosenbergiella nectarea subsp. apis]
MSTQVSNIRSLSIAELKKLAAKKKLMASSGASDIAVEKVLEKHLYPVTRAQKSFWLMSQTERGASNCNNPYAVTCHLQQVLDESVFEQALIHLSEQHTLLRTLFVEKEGEIYQVVQSTMPINVRIEDLRTLGRDAQQTLIEEYAIRTSSTPFHLATGPLWTLAVFRRGPLEYVMVATFHHIISDGWTMNVFFRSVMENYFRLLNGQQKFSLAPAQFIDYAKQEMNRERTTSYQQSVDYWQTQLEGVEGVLALPTDFPRALPVDNEGGMVTRILPQGLQGAVDQLCRQENITIFHALLANWQWLLSAYCGQQDLIVGAPFANRGQSSTLDTLGLFMNPLPLRGIVSPHLTLREFLHATKLVCEAALQHQQVSFQHILENVSCERDPRVTPLFQAMITYQLFPHFRQNPYLTYSPLKIDYGITRTDLNLWVEEDNGQLLLTLYYRKQLFTDATASTLLDNYLLFLQRMVEAPGSTIGTIELLRPEEQKKHWLPIHLGLDIETVLSQCLRYSAHAPEQLAVCDPYVQLSYGELVTRARGLSSTLLQHGVIPGEPVGIYLEKSVEYLVAILGIWLAGGGYVPLDPSHPASHLDFIVQDAGINTVVVDSVKVEFSAKTLNVPVAELHKVTQELPLVKCRLDQLAYIIYTSGSTGRPKGVRVTHRQLAHYCQNIRGVLGQPNGAKYGMISAFSTDLAHTMLFPALCHGGSLVLITETLHQHPENLISWMATHPIDCMKITPTWLSALLTIDRAHVLLPQSVLILGGENLSCTLTERVQHLAPHCRIINHYGPTETTIGVCCYEVNHQENKRGYWPIGTPLPNMRVIAVDHALRALPNGIPGELCIVGPQVSAGYCNTLSHPAFVPHPFDATQSVYRTGDRGIIRADNVIQFLGRKDRQIKIRGHRVNLGDIEILLSQLNQAYDVAITVAYTVPEQAQIVAFVAGVDAAEQQAFQQKAATILTRSMMPSLWQWPDSLPRLTSGKVNYSRLNQTINVAKVEEHLSLSATELQLQGLYSEILGYQVRDIDQHFITLGGNSLQALSLVMRVNQCFKTSLPVGALLEQGSIRQLAKQLDTVSHSLVRGARVCFQTGDENTSPTWIMVHPAGGNVLCYQPLVDAFDEFTPFYGLQVADFSTKQNYHDQIETLAAQYLQELGSLIYRSQLILGGWSLGATIAAEIGRQIFNVTGCYPTLVVLDQPAPHLVADIGQALTDLGRIAYFARKVGIFTGVRLDINAEQLAQLEDSARTALFFNAFRQAGLVPEALSLDEFNAFLSILQAHILASDAYCLDHYAGDIYVVEAEELLEGRFRQAEPGLGWQRLAPHSTQVITAPGNHLTMMERQRLTVLGQRLWQVIHG